MSGARVRLLQEDHRRESTHDRCSSCSGRSRSCCSSRASTWPRRHSRAAKRAESSLGIRAALGAGRARLIRQTLSEHLVIAIVGGALGCGVAVALTRALGALGPRATGLPTARRDRGRRRRAAVRVRRDAHRRHCDRPAPRVAGKQRGAARHARARRTRQHRRRLARPTSARHGRSGARVALTVGAGLLIRSLRTLLVRRPWLRRRATWRRSPSRCRRTSTRTARASCSTSTSCLPACAPFPACEPGVAREFGPVRRQSDRRRDRDGCRPSRYRIEARTIASPPTTTFERCASRCFAAAPSDLTMTPRRRRWRW